MEFKKGDKIIIYKLDRTLNTFGWEEQLKPLLDTVVTVKVVDKESLQIEEEELAWIQVEDCKLVASTEAFNNGDKVYLKRDAKSLMESVGMSTNHNNMFKNIEEVGLLSELDFTGRTSTVHIEFPSKSFYYPLKALTKLNPYVKKESDPVKERGGGLLEQIQPTYYNKAYPVGNPCVEIDLAIDKELEEHLNLTIKTIKRIEL